MKNPRRSSQCASRHETEITRSQRPSISSRRLPREHWSFWLAGKAPVVLFGLRFSVLMILFYILILMPFFDRMLSCYLAANARLGSGMLNWLGQTTAVSEVTIRSAHFAIAVRRGCDAVEPSWFLCAALLAFPASLGRKVFGMLVGVVLLQMLNLLRIVSLYFIGLDYPRLFNTAHVEIWPAIFIVVAIAFWVGWIGWTRRAVQPAPHVAA